MLQGTAISFQTSGKQEMQGRVFLNDINDNVVMIYYFVERRDHLQNLLFFFSALTVFVAPV
jgi:hypothetical protein